MILQKDDCNLVVIIIMINLIILAMWQGRSAFKRDLTLVLCEYRENLMAISEKEKH